MPLDGEYEPSPSEWVREQVELYEGSRGTEGTTMRGVPVVLLTIRGARTGKLRKVPLMRVEEGGRYLAVASKGGAPEHPAWYANIVANPLIELQDGPAKADYTAREIGGEERAQWWDKAVAIWPDYAEYQTKTDRQIPLVVLEPVS